MLTLLDHLKALTDHRDRNHLELTLAKALIALLPIDRVVLARVVSEEGVRRWLNIASLDARGGGKVVDPLRVDFTTLPPVEDHRDRFRCVEGSAVVEVAWAGAAGPRITYFPLFKELLNNEQGVMEVHSNAPLMPDQRRTVEAMLHVFRNMFNLLAYSDRDALTGLLNRKALDDTFYRAVLEEIDAGVNLRSEVLSAPVAPGHERRHRVPPNYWLGTVSVDKFRVLNDQYGHMLGEEVLLLVGRILGNTFRTYDRIYRFRGEQFGVLMHCPEEALVLAAFERFRANMEKFNFPQVGRVTACAGFTRVSAEDSPSTALERAERAVNHAQQQGYNKVFGHADLKRKGIFEAAI